MNGSLFDFFAFCMILFADLTAFSTTPQQVTDYSPVQQLINCRTRTLLPMKSSLLESNIPENVQENIQRSQEKQAKYYCLP
jgi:hypothetical protein